MTHAEQLVAAILSVDWLANVDSFCGNPAVVASVAQGNYRLALWSKQFENIEGQNPAICFVREMQVAAQIIATSTALAAYKSAAAAMRTATETALYYTYFRSHATELATLTRGTDWYISKDDVLNFHKTHTPQFTDLQQKLGFVARYKTWYSKISAIVHGQVPGVWHSQTSISSIKHDAEIQSELIQSYEECICIIDALFFCTVGKELWATFSTPTKSALIHGLSGELKVALGVDSA